METFRGVLAPVLTPFGSDLKPDAARLAAHCRWLCDQGCSGLAPFGTTSEANSLTVEERLELLEALLAAGIPPRLLMPGTGCCALPDTVRLTAHAVKLGCRGVLMLPPFYYKGVSDQGLFRSYSEIIQRVGSERLRIYLYHIPPITQVPISIPLIEQLRQVYPGIIAGIKDSSGDWNHTCTLLQRFPDWTVFAGSEVFLLETLRGGGAGCITASANVNPAGICQVYDNWQTSAGDDFQRRISAVRSAIQAYPVIAALKQIVAHHRDDPEWAAVRPPLQPLAAQDTASLLAHLEQLGFVWGRENGKSPPMVAGR